jgi:hypothetical protein
MSATVDPFRINVAGLRELRNGLRLAEDASPAALRAANKKVAEVVVLPEVERRARAQDRTPQGRWGHVALGTIRALATQTSASIAIGNNTTAVYALGKNFGSLRYRQFPPHMGGDPDYALYSGIGATRADTIETYGDMIDDLTKEACPGATFG